MKKIIFLLIINALAFGGRLGIGLAGGAQYPENYETATPEMLQTLCRGAEFYIQAEALPHIYIEPCVSYVNNPSISTSSTGCGIGINIRPRLGKFPVAPCFGIKGTLLFFNEHNISDAVVNGQLTEYIESSTTRLTGTAFAGLSFHLGKKICLDCQYRYQGLTQEDRIEMLWAGLSYYINW